MKNKYFQAPTQFLQASASNDIDNDVYNTQCAAVVMRPLTTHPLVWMKPHRHTSGARLSSIGILYVYLCTDTQVLKMEQKMHL